MTQQLSTVPAEVDRDRYGRPLIIQPNGGPIPYTRATTLAGAIDDLNGLIRWKIGRAVLGIVDRPDLLLSAAAHRDDKRRLNQVCDDALEAGGQSAAATIGTALHSITEQIDRGVVPRGTPAAYQADITAYQEATAHLERLHVEQMVVNDDLCVAGTPDMIVRLDGTNYIADKKTGSIDYPHKMAAQLAIYAHSQHYDPATGERTPLPAVNGQRGIIIHLPAGKGECTLHLIDLTAGWEAVQLAVQVREWRKRRGLLTPLTTTPAGGKITGPDDEFDAAITILNAGELIVDHITARIAVATDVASLTRIWQENQADWRPGHTKAAAHRKAQLSQPAS